MLTNRYQNLSECLDEYTAWYVANQTRVQTADACVKFLQLAVNGRLFILHLLRDEIMSLRQSYTDVTDVDRALDAFTAWYAANAETITDTVPLLKFLKKATDDSLAVLHLMRDELRVAQQKKPVGMLSGLWLPN